MQFNQFCFQFWLKESSYIRNINRLAAQFSQSKKQGYMTFNLIQVYIITAAKVIMSVLQYCNTVFAGVWFICFCSK